MNVIPNFKRFLNDSFPSFFKGVKSIIHFLLRPYYKYRNKKRNKIYYSHALDVFSVFCSSLKQANIVFWPTFGTLIGAVREHGFIKHDFDIDVGILDDTNLILLNNVLTEHGFSVKRKIDIYSKHGETQGSEFTYSLNGVSIDVFLFHRENVHVYTHDFLDGKAQINYIIYRTVRKITLPFDGLMPYTFLGNEVHIPINYDAYLSAHYGSDYMIPNPNWTTLSSPAAQVVEDAIGLVYLHNE